MRSHNNIATIELQADRLADANAPMLRRSTDSCPLSRMLTLTSRRRVLHRCVVQSGSLHHIPNEPNCSSRTRPLYALGLLHVHMLRHS